MSVMRAAANAAGDAGAAIGDHPLFGARYVGLVHVDGQKHRYDLVKILKDPQMDPRLAPGDVIDFSPPRALSSSN